MELQFKEPQYNWGDRFFIYDENDKKAFRVKSSILLWNKKFEIMDLDKNVLVTIKNDPKSFFKKKFFVFIQDEQVAAITKEISIIPKYTFEVIDWTRQGLMLNEYDLLQQGQIVVSKVEDMRPWGCRQILTMNDSINPLLGLAIAFTLSYAMEAGNGEPADRF